MRPALCNTYHIAKWRRGYRAVWIFLFPYFLVRKGCVEAHDMRTIPDLPDGWLHLCVSLLRLSDTVNTMPKGHKYRIDLHEAFERALTESLTTMGPVLQTLNSQVESLHHSRKNDRWCVGDEACTTFNETHTGEEKRYLYWGRVMKINSDSVEAKWDCEKEAHCYFHDHVHATLAAAFAMTH